MLRRKKVNSKIAALQAEIYRRAYFSEKRTKNMAWIWWKVIPCGQTDASWKFLLPASNSAYMLCCVPVNFFRYAPITACQLLQSPPVSCIQSPPASAPTAFLMHRFNVSFLSELTSTHFHIRYEHIQCVFVIVCVGAVDHALMIAVD